MGAADASRAIAKATRRVLFMGDLLLCGAKVRKMSLAPFIAFVKEENKAKLGIGRNGQGMRIKTLIPAGLG